MAPSPTPPDPSSTAPDRPILLNEKFKVHSYDGGSFKSRAQYDIKNVLIPIIEPFHCSGSGTKFTLVLKCSEDFTLSHFYLSGPGPRCTEPIRSGLVWVVDQPPETECLKKYDSMSSEELMEIMKGLRTYSSCDETGGLPDPCVYFTTDPTSREAEIELAKWREGKYVVVKFLDTHKDQVNIDIGIIAMIGFFGRRAKQQVPLGPWYRRTARQIWVHPNPLKSMFSSSGWVCDGRDFTGGCRSGQTDFHQTSVYTVTFRCTTSGFDLCEKCAYDETLGKVTDASLQADLEALSDPAMCKLAVTRLRNQWRRNWLATLPMYFQQGLLEALVQALQKSTEASGRPEEERAAAQRQPSGAETQKRQVRRALLQLTSELTHKLLALGPGCDVAVNDLVWALCPEPEEHWDEGRVIQLPKSLPPAVLSVPTPVTPPTAVPAAEKASAEPGSTAAADVGDGDAASSAAGVTPGAPAEKAETETEVSPSSYLVSWRDGQSPGRVEASNVWKTTANEDVMMASANLFLEVSKADACDLAKVTQLLQQGSGADLMATNGEGCTALLAAVRSGAAPEVIATLLDNGACPDATGREGVTPLQQIAHFQRLGVGDASRLAQGAELLRKHGAVLPEEAHAGERLAELRETFGLKMVGALLSLQSPLALPVEVLEVLHLLLRELPLSVVKRALEPQAMRALTALLQHLVGGTDNLSTALAGCRVMRALHSRQDPALRYLVRSHGALRWAQRLSTTKDVAQCGLYRQQHHEKVTPEELSKEAKALYDELVADSAEGDDSSDEWRANARLAEIVTSLESHAVESLAEAAGGQPPQHPEALLSFRELLKTTEKGNSAEEKGNLKEDRCTAYELEKSGVPGQLLRYLKHRAPTNVDPIRQPSMNVDRWTHFRDIFSDQTKQTRKGLVRLMKAMHAVIETGEAFPVWRHRKERGLKALTEPILLKLRYATAGEGQSRMPQPFTPAPMRPQVSVMVEPLVHVSELTRYLLRVTPNADDRYLAYCHNLVGSTIRDGLSGERAAVMSFEVLQSDLPLPIHTVRRESSGDTQRVLLGMREYILDGPLSSSANLVDLRAALCKLHMVAGNDAFPGLLEELPRLFRGEPLSAASSPAPPPTEASSADTRVPEAALEPAVQLILQQVVNSAAGRMEEALAIIAEERTRLVHGTEGAASSTGEAAVDPSMRVHTVMIAVSDEIPFDLFWPMVRDDIMGAVRELYPRGVPQMEDAVQAGVAQNGMGPVAQRLTLEEAETLAARVGHVVQTAVTVDPQAVQEVQRERTKTAQSEALPVAGRVQFSPKSGDSWVPGVVVGHGPTPVTQRSAANERYDVIDDQGVLWEQLPRGRVRLPPGRREAPSSAGTPIQAVLSQADLVRIREHLRRRQEEWAERHAQLGAGGGGGGGPQADGSAAASAAGTAATGERSGSRPTSAPAAVAQRPRATSAGALEAPGRRAPSSDLLSRDGSLGDVDPSGALEMVHFIEEEGLGDEEFDDDGDGPREPGEDGEDEDEDLPPLEPSEAGDSQGDVMLPPRLGARSREGESRGDGEGGGSMEEELRVLEQLRAMEQIISEVLDPHDGSRRSRRGDPGSGGAEDFLSAPMGNLRIRMGHGVEGRVETYQIRRAGGSRGGERTGVHAMEALRGDFPAFVRAADAPNPTSSLDHPVVERLGAADLVEEDTSADEPMEPLLDEASKAPQVSVRFCLCAQVEQQSEPAATGSAAGQSSGAVQAAPAAATPTAPPAAPPTAPPAGPPPAAPVPAQPVMPPILLPPTWNLLKAMQFLQDRLHLRNRLGGAAEPAGGTGAAHCVVQALQKVPLEQWSLGYILEVNMPKDGAATDTDESMGVGGGVTDMEVDAPSARRRDEPPDVAAPARGAAAAAAAAAGGGLPAKKRRRMLSGHAAPDEVAREMYSRFTAEAPAEGGSTTGPHRLIAGCGENAAVTDAIELLHLLKAQGPSLGIEASLWVSSKLDRKLRYQLEDPLSVVSGTLPLWAMTLPRLCPFLFSLKTRKMLLKYTAFGPSFAVHWMQESKVGSFLRRRATVQTELNAQTDPRKMQELSQELSNIEEHVVKSNFWLGTLQSTLVRMQKGDELLRQSDVAMELVSSASNLVEVQFDGETGFGSAVTQSFYVEVAQALQDRATNRRTPMWVEDDDSLNSQHLLSRRGLLVRPLVEGPQHDEAVRRFRFLGRLMGQALREGFIVPLPLTEEFFALVLGEPLGAASLPRPGGGTSGELVGSLADLAAELTAGEAALVAEGRGSPQELQAYRREQAERTDFRERFLTAGDSVEGAPQTPMSFDQYVSLVGACFLETGLSGAPLVPGGDNVPVTIENVCEFAETAARFWFETGVAMQVEAFRSGLNDVFPFECLSAFSRSELREMFCGEDRVEWDEQALLAHLHPVGGLTDRSPTYKYLVAVLLEMNQAERSRFLDFVSSCPRLPPGGIAKFHVDVFPDSTASKQGFPRSRACANQLYLPPYGSKEELQEKLHEAMHSSAGHHEQRVRDQ